MSSGADPVEPARDCEVHHPGAQHSADLARGLSDNGRLRALVTRLQYGAGGGGRDRLLQRVLALGGPAAAGRLVEGLGRDEVRRIHTGHAVVDRVLSRHPATRPMGRRLAWRSADRFSVLAATRVADDVRYVISTDSAALPGFNVLEQRRPDVVRVLDVAHPFAGSATDYLRRDASEHGFAPESYDEHGASPETIARAGTELSQADRIIVASSFTAQSLVRAGAPSDKVDVIAYGAPSPRRQTDARRASDGREALRLIFVGALSERKGVTMLVRAAESLQRSGVPFRLDVVGRPIAGYEPPPIGHLDACTYHGGTSSRDLMMMLARAHFLVLPSICEGFGRVILEALSVGTGVVTTERSVAPDLVASHPDAPIVINPVADRAELSTVLEAAWTDIAANGLDREAARAVAAHYSFERYARRLDEALRDPSGRRR